MKKENKATRIRKLVLAGFRDVAIAKLVKCHANYVYIVRTKMAETMPMVKSKNKKAVDALLQRQVDAAKDTGVKKTLDYVKKVTAAEDTAVVHPYVHPDRYDNTGLKDSTILDEAQDIIWGDREKTYGEPDVNLKRIATLWNAFLVSRYKHGYTGEPYEITSEDVCWMMVLLKASRQMNAPKRDNLIDAAGYIGLIERIQK
jgi:hypothetical protein